MRFKPSEIALACSAGVVWVEPHIAVSPDPDCVKPVSQVHVAVAPDPASVEPSGHAKTRAIGALSYQPHAAAVKLQWSVPKSVTVTVLPAHESVNKGPIVAPIPVQVRSGVGVEIIAAVRHRPEYFCVAGNDANALADRHAKTRAQIRR